jgi:hypothetical protein
MVDVPGPGGALQVHEDGGGGVLQLHHHHGREVAPLVPRHGVQVDSERKGEGSGKGAESYIC